MHGRRILRCNSTLNSHQSNDLRVSSVLAAFWLSSSDWPFVPLWTPSFRAHVCFGSCGHCHFLRIIFVPFLFWAPLWIRNVTYVAYNQMQPLKMKFFLPSLLFFLQYFNLISRAMTSWHYDADFSFSSFLPSFLSFNHSHTQISRTHNQPPMPLAMF